MKPKQTAIAALLAAAMAVAPITPALAWRHHGGPLFWPFALGAAVIGGAAAIATAPLAALAPPPYSYGQPGYYPPPPAYGPPPGYYGYGYYR